MDKKHQRKNLMKATIRFSVPVVALSAAILASATDARAAQCQAAWNEVLAMEDYADATCSLDLSDPGNARACEGALDLLEHRISEYEDCMAYDSGGPAAVETGSASALMALPAAVESSATTAACNVWCDNGTQTGFNVAGLLQCGAQARAFCGGGCEFVFNGRTHYC
jgi:hypothetical protein